MASSKIVSAEKEQDDVVVVVSSRTANSEYPSPKVINVTSNVQQDKSSTEKPDCCNPSTSDDNNDDSSNDDDYEEDADEQVSNDVESAESGGRPSRQKKVPARFSPNKPEQHQFTKAQAGKRGQSQGTKPEESKRRRPESKLKLRKNISNHVAKKREYKDKIKSLKEELKEYKAKNDRLTDENISHEKVIQKLLEEGSKLMNQSNTFDLPDDVVRAELVSIFGQCKRWAKKWAVRAFGDLPDNCMEELCTKLRQSSAKFGPIASQRLVVASRQGNLNPHIVLNALLNRNLGINHFARHFGFLKDVAEYGNLEGALLCVLSIGSKGATDTSIWRAMTVRMLDPPDMASKNTEDETNHENVVQALKAAYQQRSVSTFYDSYPMLLKGCNEEEKAERYTELLAITQEAQTLAAKLHAQNVEISYEFLDGITRLVSPVFDSLSRNVLPHRALKLHGDGDDDPLSTELDGEKIDLVIEPLIQCRRVEPRRISDIQKTWKEALVWIVRKATLQPEKIVEVKTSDGIPREAMEPTRNEAASAASAASKKISKDGDAAGEQLSSSSKSPKQEQCDVQKKPVAPPTFVKDATSPENSQGQTEKPEATKAKTTQPPSTPSPKPKGDPAITEREPAKNTTAEKRKLESSPDKVPEAGQPATKKQNTTKKVKQKTAAANLRSTVGNTPRAPPPEKTTGESRQTF